MKSRTVFLLIIFLVVVVFFVYRLLNLGTRHEYMFYPMGGIPCRVVEYNTSDAHLAEDAKLIEKRVAELESVFSAHREGIEVGRLEGLPVGAWQSVSPDMYKVLEASLRWYGRTAGAFDVTVAPLLKLWKDAGEAGRLPSADDIMTRLASVGSGNITLSPDRGLRFSKQGMALDFGGIAKGYILDEIGKLLEGRGVTSFVVSCGGDVIMKGKESFRVGIQEPGEKEGHLMMVLAAPPGGVVTSGHYNRFVLIDGKKYSHIVDPKTGRPVEGDLASVTILSDSSVMDADALATGVSVLGLEKAVELLKKSPAYKAVFLAKKGDDFEIYYSKALAGRLEYKGKWASVPKREF